MNESKAPPGFVRLMDGAFSLLTKTCFLLAGLSLVVMTAIFSWLVFGRYVLNDTPTWVEQVSLLLMMVIAFLGSAAGVNQNTHLAVAVFRNIVPPGVRLFMVGVTDLVMAVFGGMMCWYGAELTIFKWKTLIPLIQWSEGLRSLPLTIAGALICLFSTGHLIRLILGLDQRKDSLE